MSEVLYAIHAYKGALSKEVLPSSKSQNHPSFFLLPCGPASSPNPGASGPASVILFSPIFPPHTSCPLPVLGIISSSLKWNNIILTALLHSISPCPYSAARLTSRKHNPGWLCHFSGWKKKKNPAKNHRLLPWCKS